MKFGCTFLFSDVMEQVFMQTIGMSVLMCDRWLGWTRFVAILES